MAIIMCNSKDRDLLARIMRAEALGEGDLGMLMVGNVCVNRSITSCLDFRNIRTIEDVIYQYPGGLSGKDSPLFFSSPTTSERNLADRVLKGECYHPATSALWFYAPNRNRKCIDKWFDQELSGRYKNHCFYSPISGQCDEIK